jgi:dTDP-4-dehydrorhamnose 3,5-epimerase
MIIDSPVFQDARGSFQELYVEHKLRALGIQDAFVQDNLSVSKEGVLRGLHYQLGQGQAKLVRVLTGNVLDVSVDLRPESPTFGHHVMLELSAENRLCAYVPAGFGHGFLAREESMVLYKTSDRYRPELEGGIIWNDPTLKIQWPTTSPLLSEKDAALPGLDRLTSEELPGCRE